MAGVPALPRTELCPPEPVQQISRTKSNPRSTLLCAVAYVARSHPSCWNRESSVASMDSSYRYDPRDRNINRFETKDLLKSRASRPSTSLAPSVTDGGETQPRIWQNQQLEVNPSVRPVFMKESGKWDATKLPGQIIDSKAQVLTAPGLFTADGTLKKSIRAQGPKAIGAVFSYNDVSPAVNTECVHDAASWADRTSDTWDATVQKSNTARHHGARDRVSQQSLNLGQTMMLTSRGAQNGLLSGDPQPPTVLSLTQSRQADGFHDHNAPGGDSSEALRKDSIDAFWARMRGSGGSSQLSLRDVSRSQDTLSLHAVAGGHNAHLIGGQWRFLPRPMVGSPLYTDFYGPYADQPGNYYGRSWHHARN